MRVKVSREHIVVDSIGMTHGRAQNNIDVLMQKVHTRQKQGFEQTGGVLIGGGTFFQHMTRYELVDF